MEAFFCNSCEEDIPFGRARLRCLSCADYVSCADCHVIGAVAGSHSLTHSYEVYVRGVAVTQSGKPKAPAVRSVSWETPPTSPTTTRQVQASPAAPVPRTPEAGLSAEAYWGTLITPQKKPSPIFSQLSTAIFKHFATKSTDVLQPSELSALMAAAGYSPQDFPPLQLPQDEESASPADLHQRDAWLANWYQCFPLDHHLATREFPPPPPVQPHQGRIRLRDQLLHAVLHPPAPVVPNGMPLLTRQGLEEYLLSWAMEDPDDLCTRINNIKLALPPLVDEESGWIPDPRPIPRECFPRGPDAEVVRAKVLAEQHAMERARRQQQEMMAQQQQAMMAQQQMAEQMEIQRALQRMRNDHIVNQNREEVFRNIVGGWEVDKYGNRTYHPGY